MLSRTGTWSDYGYRYLPYYCWFLKILYINLQLDIGTLYLSFMSFSVQTSTGT
jgi:hypothetical protein